MIDLFILVLITVILLQNTKIYLYVYVTGLLVSYLIGIILKRVLKQPRPNSDMQSFNFRLIHHIHTMSTNEFGMPSLHAIISAYSTLYMILVSSYKEIWVGYICATVAICTYKIHMLFHSIYQIIVGLFIGICVAYICILISTYILKVRGENEN